MREVLGALRHLQGQVLAMTEVPESTDDVKWRRLAAMIRRV
jgi:hypothetical protein